MATDVELDFDVNANATCQDPVETGLVNPSASSSIRKCVYVPRVPPGPISRAFIAANGCHLLQLHENSGFECIRDFANHMLCIYFTPLCRDHHQHVGVPGEEDWGDDNTNIMNDTSEEEMIDDGDDSDQDDQDDESQAEEDGYGDGGSSGGPNVQTSK